MREMTVEEVPTVASAVRQAINNKRILTKLLARIVLSEDTKVQGQLMRLRGFSLMTMVLDEYGEDWQEVVIPVLKIFLKWPLMAKNKVANSNAEELVNKVITNAPKEEEEATSLAHQLLAIWNSLEFSYRIPVNKVQLSISLLSYSPLTLTVGRTQTSETTSGRSVTSCSTTFTTSSARRRNPPRRQAMGLSQHHLRSRPLLRPKSSSRLSCPRAGLPPRTRQTTRRTTFTMPRALRDGRCRAKLKPSTLTRHTSESRSGKQPRASLARCKRL